MQTIIWNQLNKQQKEQVLERPAITNGAQISSTVQGIIEKVKSDGDAALKELCARFDKIENVQLAITQDQIKQSSERLSDSFKQAIQTASRNIRQFHEAQKPTPVMIETSPEVRCELRYSAIERVGLYVPGGTAPLPSTVMMLAIPALIAGCKTIILCSPPPISDAILYTASVCGIKKIYAVGGAQAVAAMAYGTGTIPKVDKVFGPGNSYVTEAKRQVSEDFKGATMDIPAGPSEVLVIADEKANPDFIAADLLSQAEHGPDSQVLLVTNSGKQAKLVESSIQRQCQQLSRSQIAEKALENSRLIVVEDLQQAVELSNLYGPEHLIIQTEQPRALLPDVHNAGSVFLGAWTPESVGDYASGTNHTLPTYGYTRTYSSLGTADFMKRYTVQELSESGLRQLAPTVIAIANAEGLSAHRRAVTLRTGEEQ